MRILFIGDIFGKPGREIARRAVPALVEQRDIDFVIANVENSAAGFGVTGDIADTILGYGVDVMTSGNHIWDKKEVLDYIPRQPKLLRPANFPAGVPGRGSYVGRTRTGEPVGVINLMGRIFMAPLDDPFAAALREIDAMRAKTRVIIVDFHAEATSEKVAMGWHLDGRVTAVFGTHTHVQTADERILPKGTACLTDVGMTGPHDSIIGVTVEAALARFLNGMPSKFEAATGAGPAQRGHRHRRSRDRQGHGDRAAEPVGAGRRGACRRVRAVPVIAMSDLFSLPFEEDKTRAAASALPERRVFSVSELTAAIRALLETSFGDVWVDGEISNCRVWNTGHLYFTLKDGGAQIKAVMFRSAVRYLKFKPEDGLHVIARGRLGVYEPKGEYQIVCEHLEPHGLGALQLAFEQLKKKLQGRRALRPGAQAAAARAAAQDRDRHVARRRRDPRHHQGAAPAPSKRAPRHPPDARAGRRRGG